MMEWVYDDGGRADAGFKGTTGDCVYGVDCFMLMVKFATLIRMIF